VSLWKRIFFHLFIGKARGGVGVWDVELEFRASLGPMSHLSLESPHYRGGSIPGLQPKEDFHAKVTQLQSYRGHNHSPGSSHERPQLHGEEWDSSLQRPPLHFKASCNSQTSEKDEHSEKSVARSKAPLMKVRKYSFSKSQESVVSIWMKAGHW
uniref:Uncharacterized protein n=1 Tax=Ficedula albicollis TaxID=59894 RepID=A0A803WG66_FICAL